MPHLLQMLLVAAQPPDIAQLFELSLKLVVFCGFILYTLNHKAATVLPDSDEL